MHQLGQELKVGRDGLFTDDTRIIRLSVRSKARFVFHSSMKTHNNQLEIRDFFIDQQGISHEF